MKTRFFFVIYLHNDIIKSVIDGMRIVADPSQRNFSHVTVKGPYHSKQKKILSKDNELIQGKKIKIDGAGNFFIGNQNTVFLKCEEKQELYEIWNAKEEKTYKEFHPHITIYDGYNRILAKELYDTINKHKINFSFIVDKLDIYSSANKTELFNLKVKANYALLSQVAGFDITQDSIDKLNVKQRIDIVDRLCDILENPNSLPKNLVNDNVGIKEQSLLIEA